MGIIFITAVRRRYISKQKISTFCLFLSLILTHTHTYKCIQYRIFSLVDVCGIWGLPYFTGFRSSIKGSNQQSTSGSPRINKTLNGALFDLSAFLFIGLFLQNLLSFSLFHFNGLYIQTQLRAILNPFCGRLVPVLTFS